jgi:hypothetical protein
MADRNRGKRVVIKPVKPLPSNRFLASLGHLRRPGFKRANIQRAIGGVHRAGRATGMGFPLEKKGSSSAASSSNSSSSSPKGSNSVAVNVQSPRVASHRPSSPPPHNLTVGCPLWFSLSLSYFFANGRGAKGPHHRRGHALLHETARFSDQCVCRTFA